METRSVKMTLETAKRWKAMGGEYEQVALETFPELAERDEWKDYFLLKFNKIKGYFINGNSSILTCDKDATTSDKNTFKTEKQAKAALAYAQLTQLMALPEYNGDWVADWSVKSPKYSIAVYDNDNFIIIMTFSSRDKIAFKSQYIAEKFLSNNIDLLEQYFEL